MPFLAVPAAPPPIVLVLVIVLVLDRLCSLIRNKADSGKKPSARRSQATLKALQRESGAAASPEALSRQARTAIPWTDPRAVDVSVIMKKLADDKMFEDSFNSLDLGPGMVVFSQGKALDWYQGSFNLGRFRGDQPECCVVPIDFFPMPHRRS